MVCQKILPSSANLSFLHPRSSSRNRWRGSLSLLHPSRRSELPGLERSSSRNRRRGSLSLLYPSRRSELPGLELPGLNFPVSNLQSSEQSKPWDHRAPARFFKRGSQFQPPGSTERLLGFSHQSGGHACKIPTTFLAIVASNSCACAFSPSNSSFNATSCVLKSSSLTSSPGATPTYLPGFKLHP